MHIVTIEEMRALESQADREYGLTSAILMETAGRNTAELLVYEFGQISGQEFLLLIGPGNNGGDGLIIARYLERWGGLISLYYWKEQRLVIHGEEVAHEQTLARLEQTIQSARAILDALLGIGQARPLPGDMRDLLQRVHEERIRRETLSLVAIDLPTGMNADTGEVDPGTILMDLTITLGCPKQGFFFFPARSYSGKLLVGSIGLPPELEKDLHTEMLTQTLVCQLVPPRPLESNKGTFGKAMLLCGSRAYPGSAFLSGNAAARVGAGLITMAVTEQMLPIYASTFHEATFLILPAEEESLKRVNLLMDNLEGYRSLLLGPGMGQSSSTREFILHILERLRALPSERRPRLVIDADGLNNLSALEYWWTLLPPETVITPHPGEMGRLCKGLKVSGGAVERLEIARAKAREWQVTLVLKGACTIIAQAASAGETLTRINWKANPAMATAGTGDVLAGMITGLLAQGIQPFDAASAAVYLHAVAGERVSAEIGQAGLLAADLLPQIPRALHALNQV
ncbi:MAG TPA: NAD(P)H-hydrate dehydratase [Ktedonobacteraceae bacterium]